MKNQSEILVSICVITYNQEQWIRQTLDSIIAQQTDYAFEVIIGEDHGTDGTRVICQEYADKYENVKLLPSDTNLGLVGNWINCIRNSQGKYIMNCAGDDWWHNPNKIQQQVNFMESHPDCVICHTDYDVYNQNTGKVEQSYYRSHKIEPAQGMVQREILGGSCRIAAVTQCFRSDVMKEHVPFDKYIEMSFPREDWPTQLIMSMYGKICYLPISTSTYRVGQDSVTNMHDYEKIRNRYKKDKQMAEYLYSLYPQWGDFSGAASYYDTQVYHSLLLASYENNDYKAACRFRKHDPTSTIAKKMSYTWLTFQLYRLRRRYKGQ